MADFFSRFRRHGEASAGVTDAAAAGRASLVDRWIARGDDESLAWANARPGPSVDEIATRISAVPKSFVDDDVDLLALAGDILDDRFGRAPGAVAPHGVVDDEISVLTAIASSSLDAPKQAAAIALWVWASEDEFGETAPPLGHYYAARVLAAFAWRLSAVVDPAEWLSDAERRDEAARTFLLWSGYLPASEDLATARSLFAMRDSLVRDQAMSAALADHQHRLDVTRKLAEARAREAAARPSSE